MKVIKRLKTLPTVGQFVCVWEHNGMIWSGTFQVMEKGLYARYDVGEDDFIPGCATHIFYYTNTKFYKLMEGEHECRCRNTRRI